FREKASKGRLVKFWTSTDQLRGLVALSLQKTLKAHPAVGWVRANQVASTEILAEVNDLRKRNAVLEKALESSEPAIDDLAPLDAAVTVHGTAFGSRERYEWSVESTWAKIFGLIAPDLLEYQTDGAVESLLTPMLFERSGFLGTEPKLKHED